MSSKTFTRGTSLMREAFLSQELYDAEITRLFKYHWQYYGHVSELPNPGDYVAREIIGEQVIVIRQKSGEIGAFLNVCRHRGAMLCPAETGNTKRLTCPYHAWTFKLDGSLIAASAAGVDDSVDLSQYGLWRVHFEVWRGFIFVALGDEAPAPIGPNLDEVIPLAPKMGFENMKQIAVTEYIQPCNWKLAVENFQECYHCGPVHTMLNTSLDVEWVYGLQGDYPGMRYNESGHKPRNGQVSFTPDGNYVCKKLFGDYGNGEVPHEGFYAGMVTNPDCVAILFQADYGVVQDFIPWGIDKTKFTTRWFVNADAVGGVDYDVDEVTEIWHVTNLEDKAILAGVQKGVSSRQYRPGPLVLTKESGVRALWDTYLEELGDVYDRVVSAG